MMIDYYNGKNNNCVVYTTASASYLTIDEQW